MLVWFSAGVIVVSRRSFGLGASRVVEISPGKTSLLIVVVFYLDVFLLPLNKPANESPYHPPLTRQVTERLPPQKVS